MKVSISQPSQTIAVAYIARGADEGWLLSFSRFINSYKHNSAGINHSLYVIFKGFVNKTDLEVAEAIFSSIPYKPIYLGDESLDIGAYIEWANMIKEDLICVFNTASEILAPDWLLKLSLNLALPNVGLVGATASYESLNGWMSAFPKFPCIHLRSTAFMIDRMSFLSITKDFKITSKEDAFHFESGPKSITRQVLAKGKGVLLVGRNGRGYSPEFWAMSDTFRQGTQKNLLIADNQTRDFSSFTWYGRWECVIRTWGDYIGRKADDSLFKCKR
jgi:hypothetical protein